MYKIIVIVILVLFLGQVMAQSVYISGVVSDAQSKEPLLGAYVQVSDKLVVSNSFGYYTVQLDRIDSIIVVVSYVGYLTDTILIAGTKNITLDVMLEPSSLLSDEVEISADKRHNIVNDGQMGAINLNIKTIREMPVIMGEVDLMKNLSMSSGVQTAAEGSTGLYVRGSDPGQNLILYDNAVVYNPSHLMGFFSVFSAEAVQGVSLFKAGIPSYYGGRSASVIDVETKSFNYNKTSVSGGIGLLSSRISIESPLIKDKLSIQLVARRTYYDYLKKAIIAGSAANSPLRKAADYFFYDANLIVHYNFSTKSRFKLSIYNGMDDYGYASVVNEKTNMNWGNTVGSLNHSYTFNASNHLQTIIYYSSYKYAFQSLQYFYEMQMNSNLADIGFKQIYSQQNRFADVKVGYEIIDHSNSPARIGAKIFGQELLFQNLDNLKSREYSIFVQAQKQLNLHWYVNGGIRYTLYQQYGPFTDYTKDFAGSFVDTIYFSKNDLIKQYDGLEPRVAIRYLLSDRKSIKMSFTQNNQFIHLASMPALSMPTDLWIPSGKNIEPLRSRQYSIGYYQEFNNNKHFSTEIYFKEMYNLIEFRKGILNSSFEKDVYNDILQGNGYAGGVEFEYQFRIGMYSGNMSYTLARSLRTFDEIDNSELFPATHDRLHDLNIVNSYKLNDKWSLAAIFVYATGNAVTLPDMIYVIQQTLVSEYSKRNHYRMPPYHRLDVSVNYKITTKRGFESEWNFSIYNVYNRANPFYIYFETMGRVEDYNVTIKAKQVSLFPILPSITWNFRF